MRLKELTERERVELQELEGGCHALWLMNGGETEERNGDPCKCEWVQGNLVCKRLSYYD